MTIKRLLVINHVKINNKFFHVLEIANEVHRPSFATWQKCTSPRWAVSKVPTVQLVEMLGKAL